MNEERRGLKMIAGIAVVVVVLHLMFNQLFSEVGMTLAAVLGWDPPVSEAGEVGLSPAALLFSVGIELVIAIGSVVLLVVSGVWDLAVVAIKWTTDMLKVANEHLEEWRKEREAGEQAKEVDIPPDAGTTSLVEDGDNLAEANPEVELSEEELLLFAVKDIRDRLTVMEQKLSNDLVSEMHVDDVLQAFEDIEVSEPEVTTTSRPLDPDLEIAADSLPSKPFPPTNKE